MLVPWAPSLKVGGVRSPYDAERPGEFGPAIDKAVKSQERNSDKLGQVSSSMDRLNDTLDRGLKAVLG